MHVRIMLWMVGGSIANLYGLMAARYHKYPETKEKGIQHLPRLVMFASEQVIICHSLLDLLLLFSINDRVIILTRSRLLLWALELML